MSSTCEKIGYAPDARLLIVNCDDFGLCQSQNEGTVRAIVEGIASSCSLMLPAPWSQHAINLLQEHGFPFAVHLTLVSEYRHLRWGPVAAASKVSSLLDEAGFFPLDYEFKARLPLADLTHVEMEFRAQIEAVLAAELAPTHLDSHYHTHELTEALFDVASKLAIEYGLPLRLSARWAIDKLQKVGYPTNDHAVLDSGMLRPEEKADVLRWQLRELPTGLSEWAMHPGPATEELKV